MRPISSLSRERERAARGPPHPAVGVVGVVLVGIVAALYFVGSNNNNSPSNNPTTPNAAANQPTQHRPAHKQKKQQHKTAPAKPKTVTLQLVPTGHGVRVRRERRRYEADAGRMFAAGETIPTEKREQAADHARQRLGADEGQRQGRPVAHGEPDRLLDHAVGDDAVAVRPSSRPAHERARARPRGHRGHRHRGADRDHLRPQRPVAVRAPARARRRRGDDPRSSATGPRTCSRRSSSCARRGWRW